MLPIIMLVLYCALATPLAYSMTAASFTAVAASSGKLYPAFSLYVGASIGDFDKVHCALASGVSINAKGSLGTPLYLASQYGKTEMVSFLLEKGANPNIANDDLRTPLHIAVEKGHTDIVKLLLARNAPIAQQDSLGRTPLHYAVIKGHAEIVPLLLNEVGVAVNTKDSLGRTALHYASVNQKIMFFLLVDGEDIRGKDAGHLGDSKFAPVYFGSFPQTVKLLSDAGFFSNTTLDEKPGQSVIVITEPQRAGDLLAIFQALVQGKAHLDEQDMFGCSPLHLAFSSQFHEAALTLIEKGASVKVPDAYGFTPLHTLSRICGLFSGEAYNNFLNLLADHGAEVSSMDSRGMTPLHVVTEFWPFCYHEVIALISKGADVNAKDYNDCTPLHSLRLFKRSVAKYNDTIILQKDMGVRVTFKELITKGADIFVKCQKNCMSEKAVLCDLVQSIQCSFCASPLREQENIVSITDACSHKAHFACIDALKSDPSFKGRCPVCASPLKKEEVDECFFCADDFEQDKGMVIGKNCTHRIHSVCRQQLLTNKAYQGVCPLCFASID